MRPTALETADVSNMYVWMKCGSGEKKCFRVQKAIPECPARGNEKKNKAWKYRLQTVFPRFSHYKLLFVDIIGAFTRIAFSL